MGCSACGGARRSANTEYEITYRHDGSSERVATLAEATMKLAASPQGGTKRLVPKK
jgi:hypothetical protein